MTQSEILNTMKLLGIKEITTPRQALNGTRKFKLPMRYYSEYDNFVAKKLQQKIAEDLYDNYVSEFDEWLHKLAETNGVTNY